MLHNGTLPVVSNVEYHFFLGEHCIPSKIYVLQNLHSVFTLKLELSMYIICERDTHTSSSTVLVGCSQSYVSNSHLLMLCKTKLTNLNLFCYFSCKIEDVTFRQHGYLQHYPTMD